MVRTGKSPSRLPLHSSGCWCRLCRGGRDGFSYHREARSRPFHDGGNRYGNAAYSAPGPAGPETVFPNRSAPRHRRSKACAAFCGACYEKAKGRNYC